MELAYRVRQQIDADAERAQLGHGIEHVHLHPDFVQAEGCRQASDSGADDGATQTRCCRAHRTSCTWIRTVARSRSPVETAMRSFNQCSRGAALESRTKVR